MNFQNAANLLPKETQPQEGTQDVAEVVATADIQSTALNGAQVSSLLQLLQMIVDGLLPPDSGKAAIAAAFPALTAEQIDAMVSPLKIKEPTGEPNATFALRDVVLDNVDRMIRREAEAVKKASKKPGEFLRFLDTFYGSHKEIVARAIAPSIRAYLAVCDPSADVLLVVSKLTEQITEGSKAELLELSGQVSASNFSEAIEERVDNWQLHKAKQIVATLAI